MENAIEIVDKFISKYHIFTNLFPGIIFVYLINQYTDVYISSFGLMEDLIIYYFLGMTISRVGALIVEPILKCIKYKNYKTKKTEYFLTFQKYEDYIEASSKDSFIKTLNTDNNTYRSIISMLLLFFLIKVYFSQLKGRLNISEENSAYLLWVIIFMIYVFSYRKQTKYISERVEKYKKRKRQNDESEANENDNY